MKKKIVEVDEDVLKEIIVGDIPVFGKDSPAPKEKSVEHQEAKSPAATVPADTPAEKPSVEKPKRKKDESFGYRERFLDEHIRLYQQYPCGPSAETLGRNQRIV